VDNVSKKVNYVLTTPDLARPYTSRIGQAMKYGIPIIDEQYIHDCVQAGTRLDIMKYLVNIPVPTEEAAQAQMQAADQLSQMSGLDPMAQAAAAAAAQAAMSEYGGQDQQALGQALQQMIHSHTQQGDPMLEHLMNVATDAGTGDLDMSENSKLQIKMFVKGSRQTVFSEQFPEILYTLTWKHKYDIRILSNKKIFKGEQNKLLEAFTMMLVLAKNNEIPIYDEDKEVKRRRKRQKVAKRKQQKPTDTDTITISSLHKAAENEVIIRFGINSTFCSKRFNYSAFRLYIHYAPQDLPDDYHFTIYSAEFKTFVKKNANITKYLHYPKQLNPTTTIITKDNTTRMKTKYAQVTKHDTGSSFGGAPGNATSPRKAQRKRKRPEYGDEYEEEEEGHHLDESQQMNEWDPASMMNMMYPLFPMLQQSTQMVQQMGMPYAPPPPPPSIKSLQIPEKGICWFGEPIGMNINGDVFYMAFCKDGQLYKINDFVYLAPEEGGAEGEVPQSVDPSAQMQVEGMMPQQPDQVAEAPPQQSEVSAPASETTTSAEKPVEVKAETSTDAHPPAANASAPAQAGEGEMNEEDIDLAKAGIPSAPESYWICKIINLVQTKNEGMKLIGQWFYRWCDVQGFGCNIENFVKNKTKNQYMMQKEKEVFVSFDLNYNSLTTVRGKCFVRFMDAESQKKNKKWILEQHHYFFQTGFNRLRGEFFDLPDQMLKIMKETTNEEDDTEQWLQMYQQQQLAAQQAAMQNPQLAAMQMQGMQMPGMQIPGMQMQGMPMQMPMGYPTDDPNAHNPLAFAAAMANMHGQHMETDDPHHHEHLHHHGHDF
jgi:hypothetical protein